LREACPELASGSATNQSNEIATPSARLKSVRLILILDAEKSSGLCHYPELHHDHNFNSN